MPNITIRTYQPDDYAAVLEVFSDAYAGIDDNFASFEDMEALRLHYPDSQLVAYDSNGQIAGLILSLFCRYDYFFEKTPKMQEIYNPDNFEKNTQNGDSLFALEILVKSSHQRQGVGKLLNQKLSEVLVQKNLKAFIGVSRLSGYSKLADTISAETYIQKVVAKEITDPSLSYNCSNQMLPVRVVPDYYPQDTASAGFGALVIQKNPAYQSFPQS
jgi:predicted N-acetyltransferase YhbS